MTILDNSGKCDKPFVCFQVLIEMAQTFPAISPDNSLEWLKSQENIIFMMFLLLQQQKEEN